MAVIALNPPPRNGGMKKAPTLPLAPAQAGAQFFSKALDSRLRGNERMCDAGARHRRYFLITSRLRDGWRASQDASRVGLAPDRELTPTPIALRAIDPPLKGEG